MNQPTLPQLINGRRDTIYYTVATSWMTSLAWNGSTSVFDLAVNTTALTLSVVFTREMFRLAAWQIVPPKPAVMAGVGGAPKFDVTKCKHAIVVAMVGSIAPLAVTMKAPPEMLIPATLAAALAAVSLHQVGGAKNVYRLYRDIIFDLPRKLRGDDGGTPEAQRWKDALLPAAPRGKARGAASRAVPAPT